MNSPQGKNSNAVSRCVIARKKQHCHWTLFHQWQSQLLVVVLFNLFQIIIANPVFLNNPSLVNFQSGRNIRHLPCIEKKSGLSGTCMFAIDCIRVNGTHLGTCIDQFYFGSCCQLRDINLPAANEISDNSIDQNTISHIKNKPSTVPVSNLFKLTTPSSSQANLITNTVNMVSSTIQFLSTSISTRPFYPSTTNSANSWINITTVDPVDQLKKDKIITTTTNPTYPTEITTTTTTTTNSPIESSTIKSIPTTSTTTLKTTTVRRKTNPTKRTTYATKLTTKIVDVKTSRPTIRPQNTKYPTTQQQLIKRTTKRPTTKRTTIPDKRTSTTLRSTTKTTQRTKRPTKPTTGQRPNTTLKRTTKRPATITKKPVAATTKKTTTTRVATNKPTTTVTTNKPTPTTKQTIQLTTSSKLDLTTIPNSYTKIPSVEEFLKNSEQLSTQYPILIDENDKITTKATTTYFRPTSFPRPKPKPTAEIFKVPQTTIVLDIDENESVSRTTYMPITETTFLSSNSKISLSEASSTEAAAAVATTTTKTPPTKMKPELFPVTTDKPLNLTNQPTPTTFTTSSEYSIINSTMNQEITNTFPDFITWMNPFLNTTPNYDGNSTDEKTTQSTNDWILLPAVKPETFLNKSEIPINSTTLDNGFMSSTTFLNISDGQIEFTTTIETIPEIITMAPIVESSSSATEYQNTGLDGSQTTFSPIDEATTILSSESTTSFDGIDYKKICGRRMFPKPRIVGGANSAFGRWPWQISLRQWRTSTYLHKCGAALLNENWAITAAHCVDNVPPSDLLLRLGEYDLAEEEEPYTYQERRVQIVASHPQFDPRTFEYDLALLRFYEPVVFQPNIIPVCVPQTDAEFIGKTAYVTGWGRLYEDGPLPSVLQEVSVPVINNTICETMYRTAGYIEHIPHIFICAGWKKGGYDSCEGDSGGPMVLQRDDKRFLLAGVISWGIGCAEPNQPGVYTRISEFRDWINQILQF